MTVRRRLIVAALLLGLSAGLAACGHTGPVSGQAESSPEARLESLNHLDIRVADVAWKLARANTDLCPYTRPLPGWTLHSAGQYGDELRPVAKRRFGLDGDLPGVLAVPAGSPAALAGLLPGDLILSVNGRDLARGEEGSPAFDGLEANIAVLDEAARLGPLQLRVRRDGVERGVRVQPVQACACPTQVEVSAGRRARTDGRTIFISVGMANLAASDGELAYVLAHELAHVVLEHRTDTRVTGARGADNAAVSLRRGLWPGAETDADRLGLFLMTRAGFDPGDALTFMRAQEAVEPASRVATYSPEGNYPSNRDRRAAMEEVIADIAGRRASGRVLIP